MSEVYDAVLFAFGSASARAETAAQEWLLAAQEHARPCVIFRPVLSIDGNRWCALYGSNLQDGVAGFGDTPSKAMFDFDVQWFNAKAVPTPSKEGER